MSSRGPYRTGSADPQRGLFESPSRTGALTVSLYVARVNGVLKTALPETWVRGEIGDWKVWGSSGHAYFTLKDHSATLNGMMWADDVRRLRFRVEPGMEVLALGKSSIYAQSGKFSFVVSALEPAGIGALLLAFEQLKARLAKEGLFDASKKRTLPLLPRTIGVVTSRSGAALRDILKVLGTRFGGVHVILYPVLVQGAQAPEEITRAVTAFSRSGRADVVLIARGGGSKEDLAAFNDEGVVRAVANCRVPTISAVGHEIDITLTDLAADVRAATPSQAAELVLSRRDELVKTVDRFQKDLAGSLASKLSEARTQLLAVSAEPAFSGFPGRAAAARQALEINARAVLGAVRGIPAVLSEQLARSRAVLENWVARAAFPLRRQWVERDLERLNGGMSRKLTRSGDVLAGLAGQLSALDPLRILARGYSVVYPEGERIPIRDAAEVQPGERVRIVLARGELAATVSARKVEEDVNKSEAPEKPDV